MRSEGGSCMPLGGGAGHEEAGSEAGLSAVTQHDPEKWEPFSEKIMLKQIEWDDASKKSHPALT
jgi:hypothetical protein